MCSGNFGLGGWGVLFVVGIKCKEIYGGEVDMINNCMELMVVIEVLNVFKKLSVVILYMDSIYVKDGLIKWIYGWKCNGWKIVFKKLVKNKDLW